MWGLKNYARILVLTGLVMLQWGCKEQQKTTPLVEETIQEVTDTIAPVAVAAVQEIADGLHLRLMERLPLKASQDSLFLDFHDGIQYKQGPLTMLMPVDGLENCPDCLSWDDLLLEGNYDSPLLSSELNGLRIKFTIEAGNGRQWNFSKLGDSLIATDHLGDQFFLWQTDIKAANGLLHILKPIADSR